MSSDYDRSIFNDKFNSFCENLESKIKEIRNSNPEYVEQDIDPLKCYGIAIGPPANPFINILFDPATPEELRQLIQDAFEECYRHHIS